MTSNNISNNKPYYNKYEGNNNNHSSNKRKNNNLFQKTHSKTHSSNNSNNLNSAEKSLKRKPEGTAENTSEKIVKMTEGDCKNPINNIKHHYHRKMHTEGACKNDVQKCLEILEEMQVEGVTPDNMTFMPISFLFLNRLHQQDAYLAIQERERLNTPQNVWTYAFLLNHFREGKNFERTLEIIDPASYNALYSYLIDKKNLSAAEKIYSKMKLSNIEVDHKSLKRYLVATTKL